MPTLGASLPDSLPSPGGIFGIPDEDFETVRDLIYREAGITLSDAKRSLVCSRLAKRLNALKLRTHREYLEHLARRDPEGTERQRMINCLTTNKTDFFREPHHFVFLRDVVFPKIKQRAARGGPRRLRIWSAGCSTGEEPYSIAITLLEHFGPIGAWDVRILASDINTDVLRTAEEGVYSLDRIAHLDEPIQRRYFLRGTGKWEGYCQVRDDLRRMVTFRQINFFEHPWPLRSPCDVIFCRNVIIYFNAATQRGLLLRLADQLVDRGYLVLGHSENLYWLSEVFEAQGNTVYRRTRSGRVRPALEPVEAGPQQARAPAIRQESSIGNGRRATGRSVEGRTAGARHSQAAAATGNDRPAGLSRDARIAQARLAGRTTEREEPPTGATRPAQDACAKQGTAFQTPTPHGVRRHEIIAGEYAAFHGPAEISTLLGSCVAACLFDPERHIGGMNHFMLPFHASDPRACARYGVHSMELLINEIMTLGGDRRRLRAKAFGGANVLGLHRLSLDVGRQNCRFVREFLEIENIPLVAERLGGEHPLRVHFLSDSGRAFVKVLQHRDRVVELEERYRRQAADEVKHPRNDNVTLF
ncbi:MAG: hypothetical protein HUU20_04110 [Pirellulales bacterium]|nr:hypothetical protein [Pirellulales bacterium]